MHRRGCSGVQILAKLNGRDHGVLGRRVGFKVNDTSDRDWELARLRVEDEPILHKTLGFSDYAADFPSLDLATFHYALSRFRKETHADWTPVNKQIDRGALQEALVQMVQRRVKLVELKPRFPDLSWPVLMTTYARLRKEYGLLKWQRLPVPDTAKA